MDTLRMLKRALKNSLGYNPLGTEQGLRNYMSDNEFQY